MTRPFFLTRRVLLAGVALVVARPARAGDVTYRNPRFGTSITFPGDIFSRPLEPSENGDGMAWESEDGAYLGVWGQFNALDLDEKGMADFLADTVEEVTYRKVGKGFVVLSGLDGGKVFYQRAEFGADGVIHTLLLRYERSLKSKYDPLVGPIAASLGGP